MPPTPITERTASHEAVLQLHRAREGRAIWRARLLYWIRFLPGVPKVLRVPLPMPGFDRWSCAACESVPQLPRPATVLGVRLHPSLPLRFGLCAQHARQLDARVQIVATPSPTGEGADPPAT